MEASSSIRVRVYSEFRVQPIPEDILIEILSRLSVKTLLRLKPVCKTWYYLIKNPHFVSMHHNFNLGTASQLLVPHWGNKFSFHSNDKSARMLSPKLKAVSKRGFVTIAGSYNGIVCYYDGSKTIFLCNPATREFKQLPSTDLKSKQMSVGFGFDSSNIYDFKVLRILCVIDDDEERDFHSTYKEIRAEMFTLSSNTWKQLHCGLNYKLRFRGFGLYCANSFHFLARVPEKSNENAIFCCDIHKERITLMDFPSEPKEERGFFKFLMLFKELLAAVYSHPWIDCEEKPIEIWVMQDYGVVDSWTILYKIGPPTPVPLCFWLDGDALLLLQLNTEQLVSCDLNTLSLENIKIDGYTDYEIVVYKETLVSINHVIT